MSTILSEYLYDGREDRHEEGTCLRCGNELPPSGESSPKLYCSRQHKKRMSAARGRRQPKESGCLFCGVEIGPHTHARRFCSLRCRRGWRGPRFARFYRRVQWPQTLNWLAPQIGKEPDDPELPRYALLLAAKHKLVVYLSRSNGHVKWVGFPKT